MSQENLEIVRGLIAANRSDPPSVISDEVLARFDPDCEFISTMGAVDQQVYRGHEGIRRYRQDMGEAWSEWWVELDELSEPTPGVVLAVIRPHVVAKETGITLEGERFTLYEFAGSRVRRVSNYGSRAEALEAVGLSD